jgi:hypothetical protein
VLLRLVEISYIVVLSVASLSSASGPEEVGQDDISLLEELLDSTTLGSISLFGDIWGCSELLDGSDESLSIGCVFEHNVGYSGRHEDSQL